MADILIVSARRPARHGRGDQMRVWCDARGMAERHTVTLVVLGLSDDAPEPGDELPGVEVIDLSVGKGRRVLATLLGVARGLPAQTAWTCAGLSSTTVGQLEGRHDVMLAITSRAVDRRWALPTVVDHIDALSLNMSRRAAIDPSAIKRFAARIESRLMLRHERRIASWAKGQLVTTHADAAALPPHPTPVALPPHREHSELAPVRSPSDERPVDVMLTGNMRYPPNRSAYDRLANEVLPALRARGLDVRIRVVGRAADTLPKVDGVEIASDVPDVQAELTQAKVAIAPVDGGTGAPTKLLEAASAGAAVVAPQWAFDAFGVPLTGSPDPASMATLIAELLEDPVARQANVDAFAEALRRSRPDVLAAIVERELLTALGVPPSGGAGTLPGADD